MIAPVELRDQKYFVAVAEELHFGRAAVRLRISQPALSKQIRALEEELGTPLLWRTKREVRLTPAGVSFLSHSRQILSHANRSIAEAQSVGRGELGSLEIGYVPSAAPRIVPLVVRTFKKKCPKVDVRIRLVVPPNILSDLRTNQIDFLFIGLPIPVDDLAVEKIAEEPYILAVPNDHPLASRASIGFKQLDGMPMVMWPRHLNPESYDNILRLFKNAGATLKTALETFPLNSLVCAVAAGVGVSLVPDCARDIPQRGVVYRDLKPPRPSIEWGIVYPRKKLGGAQEEFLNVVREIYRIPPAAPVREA